MVTAQKKSAPPPPEYDDADGIEDDDELDENSPYISFVQACKRYDISRQALHSLCAQGKIPYYVRYNGRRRFLREEADEYLGMARVEATNPLPKRSKKG
jgi:predicted DNA-binding transcriptional regulator AlpA